MGTGLPLGLVFSTQERPKGSRMAQDIGLFLWAALFCFYAYSTSCRLTRRCAHSREFKNSAETPLRAV